MVTPPEGDDRDVVEAPGADRALFRERWRALSRRARLLVTGTACVVVLGVLLGYVVTNRPTPPPPDPVAVTTARITFVEMPHRLHPDFGVTVRVETASRVTFTGLKDGYANLFVVDLPAPGIVLEPGQAHALHARLDVFCQTPFPRRGTPLLFVAVRNAHGEGRAPVVPTDSQVKCIVRAVRLACA
ncbi:hypothetical protein [Streptomyces xylophagus]|uniref:hypothetical protein n=1 Tax=Streptomyces xylophagus TaxID=285514 RepID=UPI0005BCD934|nr:hypothetical protein [Streptomyces xylophagus]